MEETFQAFHRVLSFVGISIFSKNSCCSKPWLFLQIFNFIISILCFVFTTGFVATNTSNLLLFIQGACIWTTGVIMTISLGVCLFFRAELRSFLNEMAFKDTMCEMPLVCFAKTAQNGKLHELKVMVEETQEKLFKYTRILLITYVASVWLCSTLYLCSPIVIMAMNEGGDRRMLAFDMWFPWSLQDLNVYIASFIFHAYCGYLCCIAYPGLQSMIILLNGQVLRQLRILTFIVKNLNEIVLEITRDDVFLWQIICTNILSQCISRYVKLKRFSNRLNVICRPFYLTLILVATMLVCMCSVKISISSKWSLDTMKYYIHEVCFILVVLMFCLLGQQAENECEVLQNAVLEKWYIFNNNHKINALLFSIAVSQSMPIYIFGSITLSLPTFTWFIKTGMSFFTLMMSFLEEE